MICFFERCKLNRELCEVRMRNAGDKQYVYVFEIYIKAYS